MELNSIKFSTSKTVEMKCLIWSNVCVLVVLVDKDRL